MGLQSFSQGDVHCTQNIATIMAAAHRNGLNGVYGDEKQITELKERRSGGKRFEIILGWGQLGRGQACVIGIIVFFDVCTGCDQ